MDRLHKYFEIYISTETCNLRCPYCYITQKRLFNKKIAKYNHSAEEIGRALSKERMGGVCLFNLCAGGETLLSDEVIPVIKAMASEGHYISLVSNLTIGKRVKELCELPLNIQRRVFIKCSFHYSELKRLGLLDKFVSHIQMLQKGYISYTIELVPHDELVPLIPEIMDFCMSKFGTLPHVTIARDDRTSEIDHLSKYTLDDYRDIWSEFKSSLFAFKMKIIHDHRDEHCHAGEWSGYIDLESGKVRPCYTGEVFANIYENLNQPLPEKAIDKCPFPYCYNGHAFLTLGIIPEYEAPTYLSLRERRGGLGRDWLTDDMRCLMSQKLGNEDGIDNICRKE